MSTPVPAKGSPERVSTILRSGHGCPAASADLGGSMPVAVVLVMAVLPPATGTTGATNPTGVSAWHPGTSGLVIDIKQTLGRGIIAGAVGTTALNATTYADMVLRARPASTTPEM